MRRDITDSYYVISKKGINYLLGKHWFGNSIDIKTLKFFYSILRNPDRLRNSPMAHHNQIVMEIRQYVNHGIYGDYRERSDYVSSRLIKLENKGYIKIVSNIDYDVCKEENYAYAILRGTTHTGNRSVYSEMARDTFNCRIK